MPNPPICLPPTADLGALKLDKPNEPLYVGGAGAHACVEPLYPHTWRPHVCPLTALSPATHTWHTSRLRAAVLVPIPAVPIFSLGHPHAVTEDPTPPYGTRTASQRILPPHMAPARRHGGSYPPIWHPHGLTEDPTPPHGTRTASLRTLPPRLGRLPAGEPPPAQHRLP